MIWERREKLNKETKNAGKGNMALEHEALTERIMGVAIGVDRRLGRVFSSVIAP